MLEVEQRNTRVKERRRIVYVQSVGCLLIGAGEASADVPEGEEDKVKEDEAVAEGIVNQSLYLCEHTLRLYIYIT